MIFTCMLSSMLTEGKHERIKSALVCFSHYIPNQIICKLQGYHSVSQDHLHTVPGGQVFVYDLPARQVAHSACDLNGHVHQVLLRDRLEGNEREGDNVLLRGRDGKTQKGREQRRDFRNWCQIVLYILSMRRGSKMEATSTKTISDFKESERFFSTEKDLKGKVRFTSICTVTLCLSFRLYKTPQWI